MSFNDPLIHPAFLDPRSWGDINLYDRTVSIDREPLRGEAHFTPDRPFTIHHLKLDLRFDEEAREVSGSATLTLSPMSEGLTHVELDVAEMEIAGVTLLRVEEWLPNDSYRTLAEEATSLEFETRAEKLSLELHRKFSRRERLVIEIVYSCSPRKGLYFIRPDRAYPTKARQVWSQGQNEDAHWWFPCHDVTNQKMSTELLATVRSKYFALSNGELIGAYENPRDGTRTFHWSQSQPHPAYLVTVVIGEYDILRESYNGLPLDYYVYKDRASEGQRLFDATPRMVKFFEQIFGYPFPYSKYSQVVVEDFLFGAMENTTASTFSDRCLLDDRAALDVNYDDIVAHELSHQWWGNLVTCKDWTQIWLNESFATYSEHLWRENTEGRDAARFALFQDFLIYLNEDRVSHRRPLVHKIYRFSEELMDRHAYEKGACVLDMLRWTLGDDAFFRSLSHYLNRFEFSVAETNDFKVAIEEATGQNLHWFFDQWIYGEGYPEFEVSYEWQREQRTLKLSVNQRQVHYDNGQVFRTPVEIEIVGIDSSEVLEAETRKTYLVMIEKQAQEFYFPCDAKPKMVLFDKGNRIFKLMRFPKSAQELLFQLTRDEDALGRVRAARELAAFQGEEILDALNGVLLGEEFFGVKMAAAISLGEIGGPRAQSSLIEGYRENSDPRVRRSCIFAIGDLKGDGSIEHDDLKFLRLALEQDQSYFVAVAVIRALAHLGGEKGYDILRASLAYKSWQDIVASAVFQGLAHAKEKRAVELALEHSHYGKPTPLRVAAIGYLGAIGKELNKDKDSQGLRTLIVDYLIDLLKDKNPRVRVSAIRALGKIGAHRSLAALRVSQSRECLDQLKAALLDAIESVEKSQ
jgi:aminopeptidase N